MNGADPDTRGGGDPPRRGRRPGPDSAREDVIQAARGLFAEVGYDKASVRAIARRAGVDPALVYRFFGSKEGLLSAALRLPFDLDAVLAAVDEHPGDEGRALVRRALMVWRTPQVREQFAALLRVGISHEHARAALRDLLTTQLLRHLETRVPAADAEFRAGLIGSQLAGLALARYIIGLAPIATATEEQLIDAVGPTIQRYLTGTLTGG